MLKEIHLNLGMRIADKIAAALMCKLHNLLLKTRDV